MNIKIIRRQNKKDMAETFGKYTFWVYTKDSKNRTIARDYINSDIDLEKEKIVSLIKKTPYLTDKLYDNEELFIYKKNNHNRVVVGLKSAFLVNDDMDKLYKDLEEIQETFEYRNHNNIDYYDTKNVCVIHFKFGRMQKGYSGLSLKNGLTQEFINEYKKYFDYEGDKFKTARDIVEYVEKHNLPVIFYSNFEDREYNLSMVKEWVEANE